LPAVLTSDDYPNLIEPGGRIDTIAVPTVLAAYNWPPNTERYGKLVGSDASSRHLWSEKSGGGEELVTHPGFTRTN
jgi:hypothetical protein